MDPKPSPIEGSIKGDVKRKNFGASAARGVSFDIPAL
jgi:hypothetical protein